MDTQFESTEEFLEYSRRIVSQLLSDTFDDAFDVNELGMGECVVLPTMAITMANLEFEDLFRDKFDASVLDKYDKKRDEITKSFRQFFRLNTYAKTNFLKLIDKIIDEYTATHESWGEIEGLYPPWKKLIVEARDAIKIIQLGIIQKYSENEIPQEC